MHRQIVYNGALPLETDLLYTNKFAMVGLAKLAAAMMGTNTYVNGLACTPTSPASMVVNVAPGEIYSLANIDGTAYSSLAADTAHSILKQGIILDATQFTLVAPTTAGYSVNYLVEVTYSDTDAGATVLPYYNSANPSSAYSGPNGAGTAQNTYRAGVCTLAIKAGVPATTGTQTTPAVDTGYSALYVITVAQGATSITAANIALAAGAPFLPANGLIDGIQRRVMTYAVDTGTANAYIAQYFPAPLSLTDGMELEFKAKNANTAASTFNPNGLGASPIFTLGGQAFVGGEITVGSLCRVKWSATLSSWLLINASSAPTPVLPAAKPNQAPQLQQVLQISNYLSEIAALGSTAVAAALTNLGLGGLGAGSALPVGVPVPWPVSTPPTGWLKCNGAAFSATTYPQLAVLFPTLILPDLRGSFIRGWDDGGGVDTGRTLQSLQLDAVQNITGQFGVANGGVGTANGAFLANGNQYAHLTSATSGGDNSITFDASRVVRTAAETRPRNVAFNFIVRAA